MFTTYLWCLSFSAKIPKHKKTMKTTMTATLPYTLLHTRNWNIEHFFESIRSTAIFAVQNKHPNEWTTCAAWCTEERHTKRHNKLQLLQTVSSRHHIWRNFLNGRSKRIERLETTISTMSALTNSVRHHGQTSTASLKRIKAERRIATVLHYTLARATCPLTYRSHHNRRECTPTTRSAIATPRATYKWT